MLRRIFATLLFALVCLALPASGLAQGQVLTASIPFNFNFGEREMAQGKYTILIEGNGVVQLRSEHDGALALSRHAEPGASSCAACPETREASMSSSFGDTVICLSYPRFFGSAPRWKFRRARASEK